MSMRYRGGVISATPPVTSPSVASGVWSMSQQMQAAQANAWPKQSYAPTVIGQAYGGGFYAGKISTTANGVATHYLIVAPKSTGESQGAWGTNGVTTGVASVINGPTNTTSLVALGSAYAAAIFCNNLNNGGGLNGYKDWYMPAKNELEVLYYFLKPSTDSNNTSFGSNVNAVSPEPYNTNYTTGNPAQTGAGIGFRSGETEAFESDAYGNYWSSSEDGANNGFGQVFTNGAQWDGVFYKSHSSIFVRAVRRIPV